ncbi:MAG: hypothetical protein IH594_02620, partial [Bacteroidales bacterium]|nr:hypothetical protein [Bacteroidales bacterium]
GIFEYEVFDDRERTLSLTLIRACRIKLKVSEEKITELPDEGIQCPGVQEFEYAICPHSGDHISANLINLAAQYHTSVRSVMSGRGKGNLPLESFLFNIDNPSVHVTAVKLAEDEKGIILRMVNIENTEQNIKIEFSFPVKVSLAGMDENATTELVVNNKILRYKIEKKKILTLRVKPLK